MCHSQLTASCHTVRVFPIKKYHCNEHLHKLIFAFQIISFRWFIRSVINPSMPLRSHGSNINFQFLFWAVLTICKDCYFMTFIRSWRPSKNSFYFKISMSPLDLFKILRYMDLILRCKRSYFSHISKHFTTLSL